MQETVSGQKSNPGGHLLMTRRNIRTFHPDYENRKKSFLTCEMFVFALPSWLVTYHRCKSERASLRFTCCSHPLSGVSLTNGVCVCVCEDLWVLEGRHLRSVLAKHPPTNHVLPSSPPPPQLAPSFGRSPDKCLAGFHFLPDMFFFFLLFSASSCLFSPLPLAPRCSRHA